MSKKMKIFLSALTTIFIGCFLAAGIILYNSDYKLLNYIGHNWDFNWDFDWNWDWDHYDYDNSSDFTESRDISFDDSLSSISVNTTSIDVFIKYDDNSNTEKAQITRAYYGDILKKYSRMYGLDPKIIIAIATQEKGIHSNKKDPGGATGLMQIQNDVWAGKDITAFNYETNKYETLRVEEKMLGDIFYNIKIGCMYFQNCMDYMDNNIIAAIQCYNMGCGSMDQIINKYSLISGKSTKEILENVSDCSWMDYRYIIESGDQKYIENVLQWLGPEISVCDFHLDRNIASLKISNISTVKVYL